MTARGSRVVASGEPTFELHTLGWRAFQDLCADVLRTVWGQSAQAFADSNDAGRDGAFYGIWHDPPNRAGVHDYLRGPFVLQCKHTKKADSTLSESDLREEFDKVPGLVERGLCRSYVLMTNARVTGNSEEKIRERLRKAGVEHPLVLAGGWVCATIAAHRELRLFVPRVYGLGDLSQILDERAYAQASALIAAARDQVATFVITEPYRRAAEAVQDHGFVLLLGEPAVGKSVIAVMLALAAADNWDCLTVKARTASEVVDRWNPHEPSQFFWVDDAFGDVRHQDQLTHDWARSMPHVMTAVSKGARVVLTSRDYIYQDARPLLKEYAYPRLREHKVLVNVEDLTVDERKQILYNHLALGDQPAAVKAEMKPFLDHAATVEPFRPEMARRLGLRAFTSGLRLTEAGIAEFMTRPREFLKEIYEQLDVDQQAALALVYAAAVDGSLESPLTLDEAQRDIISRTGSTPVGATRALDALTGSFLQVTGPPLGRPGWTFRHPTLWEGFASWVPTQSHLLTVLLAGLTDTSLLTRVDCDDETADQQQGMLLRVPPPLYRAVAQRLATIRRRPFAGQRTTQQETGEWRITDAYEEHLRTWSLVLAFLARRSNDAFLRIYLDVDPDLPAGLMNFGSDVSIASEPPVLARLHRAGLLSEQTRLRAVDRMAHLAITTPDDGWINGSDWKILLTSDDRARLFEKVRTELVPRLGPNEGWGASERDEDDPIESALFGYERAFENAGDFDTAGVFAEAREMYSQLPTRSSADYTDLDDRTPLAHTTLGPAPITSRSIFDDVDTERELPGTPTG